MKIAQIVPPFIRVPPEKYGGTELICSLLVEELVRLGHEVTLFASGDSKTSAKLRSILKKPIGIGNPDPRWASIHFSFAFEFWREFDLIHNHGGMDGLVYAPVIGTPVITTLHNLYLQPGDPGFEYFGKNKFIAISKRQRESAKGLNIMDVVYNCVDLSKFRFKEDKRDYLLWLSNCIKEKGPDVAIRVAKELGMRLIMSGKLDKQIPEHMRYFEEAVKPHVDDKMIIFKEEVTQEEKAELFENAACLLFPIRWEEPFGMVMVEAMACGTPVVAYGRGSVPELIKNSETGYVVEAEDYSNFVKRVKDVLDGRIDPKVCRRHVEENFTPQVMTNNYLKVYERLSKA